MSDIPAAPGYGPWHQGAVGAIYTLTPTHVGSGQAAGAVDLPIARDASNGLPVLPGSALKGVARELMEDLWTGADANKLVDLFGPDLFGEDKSGGLAAALLAFTEARLAAYPVRSLNRPFLHLTCPLLVERLMRDTRLLVGGYGFAAWGQETREPGHAYVADPGLAGTTLVVEDLAFAGAQVRASEAVTTLAQGLAWLLPGDDLAAERERLTQGLVMIPDGAFHSLLERALPVVARTRLTGGKTTDQWKNPETGREESGNLWYEEHLPSDCLFIGYVGQRRRSRPGGSSLEDLVDTWGPMRLVQIGGNETVGQGLCAWGLTANP